MSEMSSFYGGRQGASFVIVKRFDGIDIPQPEDDSRVEEHTYTANIYAIKNNNNDFIITQDSNIGNVDIGNGYYLIAKDRDNYAQYYWKKHDNDGSQINDSGRYFPKQLAEGMVQCFLKGVESSSEVNYGEYVIIDTMLNMHGQNDPDNGKVFRRGMDIQGDLAGAEYIGQIVGPQGESPELGIDHYDSIIDMPTYKKDSYTLDENDIVPGSYIENDERKFNDEIKYSWVTIRDEFGNVEGCLIGFKLPTLVQDFEAESLDPYDEKYRRGEGTADDPYYYTNLITEDEKEYTAYVKIDLTESFDEQATYYIYENDVYIKDPTVTAENFEEKVANGLYIFRGEWKHPFYQKWQIKIPEGIHGINSTNFEIIPSYTKTPEYKKGNINVYEDPDCNTLAFVIEPESDIKTYPINGTILREDGKPNEIKDGNAYDINPSVISAQITIKDGTIRYVKKEDCYMNIVRYRETDFKDTEVGATTYYYVCDFNTIERVSISEDGTLTVFYSAEKDPQDLEEKLRWIWFDDTNEDTKKNSGITIADDGTIKFYYNTLITESEHEYQEHPEVLSWITGVTLTPEGKFDVSYNNETIQEGGHYETTLEWIDKVDATTDGAINFYYNTNNEEPKFTFEKVLKRLDDVEIETVAEGAQYEGTGDQKVHITYNTKDSEGNPETEAIGNPLNYIIETAVCVPTTDYPNVPYNHLLVYYSDPDLRGRYRDKWVKYPSSKVIDGENPDTGEPIYHVWSQWVDLGNVRGAAGGIHIIKHVTSYDELKDGEGNWIPPELLTDNEGHIIKEDGAGWSCTYGHDNIVEILAYDYETLQWYTIGTIDSAAMDPTAVIVKSNNEPSTLNTNGFWLVSEQATYAI